LLLNPNRVPKIPLLFLEKRKKECYDLGVSQNLTEFTIIHMLESLKNIIFKKFKKKQMGILKNLAGFNSIS
jgi:hypothetical protein